MPRKPKKEEEMDAPNLPLLLLLTCVSNINAQDLFPHEVCATTGNFTANSTYQTTLTTLLSSISTTNSFSLTYGFFNASATVSGTSQNLYVIGSCRSDLTAASCVTCLNASACGIRHLCPLQKEVVLYSENCTIRYSNALIFSTVETDPDFPLYNVNSISDQVTFVLETLLDGLWGKAAGGGSLRKYATRNVSVGFNTVYAMAQCTPDSMEQQCICCLEKVVGSLAECCIGKMGMRTVAPVANSVQDLVVKCPNEKVAYSWGTGDPPCFIWHSDTPIYGKLQTEPTLTIVNHGNTITMDQNQFDEMWRNLTQRLASEAADGSSELKFKTGQADLLDNKTTYSLVQCSPDLLPNDCGSCLDEAINDYDSCCRGWQGGYVYKPSCIFRWELHNFFELSPSLPSSSPPPAAASPVPGGNIAKGALRLTSWKK